MTQQRKPLKHSKEETDLFWVKISLIGLLVILVSVFAGNWLGRYLVGKGLVGKATPEPIEIPVVASPEPAVTADFFQETPSPIPSSSPTVSPSSSPSPSGKPTASPSSSPKVSAKPSPTPTPKPSPTPTPTLTSAPTRKPAPTPAPTKTARPTPSPALPATASPKPESPTGTFIIHLGSFVEEENLNKLVGQLRDLGYSPVVKKVEVDNQTYSRVELGEYGSRASAEEESRKLEEKGFKPRVVPR